MRREKFLVNFCCCSGNLKSLFFVYLDLIYWTPSHHNTLDSTDMHVNAKYVLNLLCVLSYRGFRNIRNTSLSIQEVTLCCTLKYL